MTPDEAAFLRAICERPDDDTPRLVYADWLDERGRRDDAFAQRSAVALRAVLAAPADDAPRLEYARVCDEYAGEVACRTCDGAGCYIELGPNTFPQDCRDCRGTSRVPDGRAARAEFVRVQCELAGLLPPDVERDLNRGGIQANLDQVPQETWKRWPEVCALRRRERELWGRYWKEWFGGLGVPGSWLGLAPGDTSLTGGGGLCIVRRGFVSEVRAPLAVLFGVVCRGCEGRGTLAVPWRDYPLQCPPCKGTGRTPGVAAALFSAHPVERVEVTDREPYYNGAGYAWYRAGRPRPSDTVQQSAELPADLYDLVDGDGCPAAVERWTAFPTREAARDALSAACVAWGRALAGGGKP